MPAVGLSRDDFDRVFGARDDADAPGRSRLCRSCGGWHRMDRPWPHNCRAPAPPRNPDLATPQIAPPFHAFQTVGLDPEVIGSRHDKREYMAKNDLVEYDAGVQPEREPTEREVKAEFAAQIKRFVEADPLAIKPVDVIGQTDLSEAPEVSTDGMEVFND